MRDALRAAGLAPWGVREGVYTSWDAPLLPPDFQAHAHLPGGGMLDLMLGDLSDGLWRYHRDPAVTLPLEEARLRGPGGLPYLAPQAALLFKSRTRGRDPRPRDEADFAWTLPLLGERERGWLRRHLGADHPWQARLED